MSTDIKRGDRVRVVIEDTVSRISANGTIYLENDVPGEGEMWVNPSDSNVVSVEKIEPPVEAFGPGDILRRKVDGSHIVLGVTGYTYLLTGGHYPYGAGGGNRSLGFFTSERFEKVELVEKPF